MVATRPEDSNKPSPWGNVVALKNCVLCLTIGAQRVIKSGMFHLATELPVPMVVICRGLPVLMLKVSWVQIGGLLIPPASFSCVMLRSRSGQGAFGGLLDFPGSNRWASSPLPCKSSPGRHCMSSPAPPAPGWPQLPPLLESLGPALAIHSPLCENTDPQAGQCVCVHVRVHAFLSKVEPGRDVRPQPPPQETSWEWRQIFRLAL